MEKPCVLLSGCMRISGTSTLLLCLQLKGVIVENTFTSLLDMLYVVFPFLRPFRLLVRIVQVRSTVAASSASHILHNGRNFSPDP